ncbi:MAG: S-formylglutathione hydrolase, partial [Gammaproteobacteria bacterium]|nr:S-formylglutathione hydrolase [Gammaproteobacteria bacterium]
MEQVLNSRCFNGEQQRYLHTSTVLDCDMHFSIYLPPAIAIGPVPVIYWLSGLTCTDENFVQKAGAQRYAAHHGVALVAPDTSPRGKHVPDDPDEGWDFGKGAGFYVNATQPPWDHHYNMYDYITQELPQLINESFAVDPGRAAIMGHSMGGHGALTMALRNTGQYASVSAFAPICAPSRCPWGQKALGRYLGDNQRDWETYDATALVYRAEDPPPMLIDQGNADEFLDEQLNPQLFASACEDSDFPLLLNMREGYD